MIFSNISRAIHALVRADLGAYGGVCLMKEGVLWSCALVLVVCVYFSLTLSVSYTSFISLIVLSNNSFFSANSFFRFSSVLRTCSRRRSFATVVTFEGG